MKPYQQHFIEFAIKHDVLRFGSFTLKSGRVSPYFFNSGLFNTGEALAQLGRFYADAIIDSALDFDVLYGPAYKGIPLASTTAIALADQHQRSVPYVFNRKEIKDHGEGGQLVGGELIGKTLIIDDVISAGTSVKESIDIIQTQAAQVAGVVIALDRQETAGDSQQSAIQQLQAAYQIPVASIITLSELMAYLQDHSHLQQYLPAIQAYRRHYGCE